VDQEDAGLVRLEDIQPTVHEAVAEEAHPRLHLPTCQQPSR